MAHGSQDTFGCGTRVARLCHVRVNVSISFVNAPNCSHKTPRPVLLRDVFSIFTACNTRYILISSTSELGPSLFILEKENRKNILLPTPSESGKRNINERRYTEAGNFPTFVINVARRYRREKFFHHVPRRQCCNERPRGVTS